MDKDLKRFMEQKLGKLEPSQIKVCSCLAAILGDKEVRRLTDGLTVAALQSFLYQLLKGLAFSHSRGIMHRCVQHVS